MRVYTAHLRAAQPPVLVREGFSAGAFVFGPLWLFAHRAWIAAVLLLCAWVMLAALPGRPLWLLLLILAWATGLWGHDLRRWSLARAGYTLVHVVAAPGQDAAMALLLARRPELTQAALV